MQCYSIIAMRLGHRTEMAPTVQQTLTRFGCVIKTRLGLHDVGDDACANEGILILQVCGEKQEIASLLQALNELEGVRAKWIDLDD